MSGICDWINCNMTVADNNYLPNVAKVCDLPKETIAKQKYGFCLPSAIWLHDPTQRKALAADSLTNLKSRRLIRSDFIDTLPINTFKSIQDIMVH